MSNESAVPAAPFLSGLGINRALFLYPGLRFHKTCQTAMYSTLLTPLFLSHHIQEPFQQMQRFLGGQTGGQKHQPEKLSHLIHASGCDIGRKQFFNFSAKTNHRAEGKRSPLPWASGDSLEEAAPEVVRQSPCSRWAAFIHKSFCISFSYSVLYQHIVLLKDGKHKCERPDLTGAKWVWIRAQTSGICK